MEIDKIEKINNLLQAEPKDNFLRHALALEYIKIGETGKAKDLFTAILTDSPEYVGSYYHLAKLLESLDDIGQATEWYEKGMQVALKLQDKHAYNELRSAYEEMLF